LLESESYIHTTENLATLEELVRLSNLVMALEEVNFGTKVSEMIFGKLFQ
jgi:hypothetical protein